MLNRMFFLRWFRVVIDLVVLSVALWAAVYLRFEGDVPEQVAKRTVFLWPYIVGLQYTLLIAVGVPRFAWRYVGLREGVRIWVAIALGSSVLTLARLVAGEFFSIEGPAQYLFLPLGVIGIDFALAFLGISGVRILRRLTTERADVARLRAGRRDAVRTLLVGAGKAGVMLAKEIESRPELGVLPVGFVDDDPLKQGSVIHGLPVLGSSRDVKRVARERGAKQAIIAIANAPGATVRTISRACQAAGLGVKVVPGMYQIVGGEIHLERMRDVAIDDLLRRAPVELDSDAIAADLRGKTVLVTGAGGSIGSEVCRQVCRFRPKRLVLVERSENSLFEIHRELSAAQPNLDITPVVADICVKARIQQVFRESSPHVVFHAAAHKHVPMMEWNPREAVYNNVLGTQQLADVAHATRVKSFVMISTDKAVNPTSVMGATKRVAEIYVQALAKQSNTRFVTVRFGNVLGSNGSVVPIFKQQIARGGPITITHPDMKRYFMTIPEACQLVLQAGAMGRGGEIFILDMGEPVRIVDLARDLIELSGFHPDEIPVVFTGTRPGEKLFEELSIESEATEKTRHPKVFVGTSVAPPLEVAKEQLQHLHGLPFDASPVLVRRALAEIVPEYSSSTPLHSSTRIAGTGEEATQTPNVMRPALGRA